MYVLACTVVVIGGYRSVTQPSVAPIHYAETYFSQETASQTPTNVSSRVKLPTIHIQHFDGNYTEYTPFINLFSSIVNRDKTLDNVQKLYYLRSFLRGEPFDIIKNLPLTHTSYEEGLKLLDERYNNKYRITNEHINALLDLSSMVKSSPQNIREFVSQAKQILAALRNLGSNVDNWDDILLCILTRKLDAYTSRAYQLDRKADLKPSVHEFFLYLEQRALALENAEPIPTPTTKSRVTLSIAEATPEDCIMSILQGSKAQTLHL
ncbi:Tel1 [Operophtera brumata]|uniref:Tel1 n=1 Tax=Operophtera brumata TaxID=104452 RepID=A0A0L7LA22_OPEBR|nr:Tel1 [Operophtera brumata]